MVSDDLDGHFSCSKLLCTHYCENAAFGCVIISLYWILSLAVVTK